MLRSQQTQDQDSEIRRLILDLIDQGRAEEAADLVVAMLGKLRAQNNDLAMRLQKALKGRFGRSSEKIDANQLNLLLEELADDGSLEQDSGDLDRSPERVVDEGEPREEDGEKKQPKTRKRGGRKPLPKDLARERIVVSVPETDRTCTSCGSEMRPIGFETSEVLEFVPAQFKVLVYEREKLACARCEGGGVVTAPTADKVIEKGLPGPGLLAHIVVSKHQDHLPLYRQRTIFKRQGVDVPRATLGRWCAEAAELTQPLVDRITERVLGAYVLQTDDTHLRVLDRDHPQGIRRGAIWAYVGDGRWAVFDYTPTRSQEGPLAFLESRKGWLQADAYSGYDKLFEGEDARCIEVGCWAHSRRRFSEALDAGDVRAAFAMEKIQTLYQIERRASEAGILPQVRAQIRQEQARPVLDQLKTWIDSVRGREPPQSLLGEALTYATNQWTALCRYLEDGHLEIDNTRVERLIRMIAVGRRNYLFAGSEAGAHRVCTHYSLIATCRLHEIDPEAYLADVYGKLASGWLQSRIDELLPDAWAEAHPDALRCTRPA